MEKRAKQWQIVHRNAKMQDSFTRNLHFKTTK